MVGAVALVALLVLAHLAAGLVGSAATAVADERLREAAVGASERLSTGAPVPPSPAGPVDAPLTVRVLDTAGTPVDGGPPVPLRAPELRRIAAGQTITVYPASADGSAEPRRVLAMPAAAPDGTPRLVVASADLVGYDELLARARVGLLLGALLVTALVAAVTWGAVRLALRPVDRLRAAATSLPPGQRLPVPPSRDELAALAVELNELLARRDAAVERLERFTADAAHELRSPVAAIRAQAEVAVAHPDPSLAAETLQTVADEAARLSELLSDLLALARADSGRRADPSPVDLVGAARAAVGRRPGSPDVRLVSPLPATVSASPAEVSLVLDNLLDNARRHAASAVTVSVLPAGSVVRLVVDDDGPGVPAADRQRVFDRFTRLDQTADGGSGLGLALVHALVRGRGGSVVMADAPEGGARVEVRWPAR